MSRSDNMGFTQEEVDQQIERALSGAPGNPEEQARQRALQPLQRAYQVRSEAHVSSLERVWQRVLDYEAQGTMMPSTAPHAQERVNEQAEEQQQGSFAPHVPRHERPEVRRRPRRPLTLFAQVAAVFCLMVIVGSFVLVTALMHRGQPLSPKTVHGKAVALQTIHMFDARAGWAIYNQNRILHTTAGLSHWRDVSPAFDTSIPTLVATNFLTPETAWVVAATSAECLVYRTNDGGQTWQKALLPDRCLGDCQLALLNTQDGWLLIVKGAAAGSEAVDILRTTDGGTSWKVISVSNYDNTMNNPTAIPFGGDKSGISFVNATTGWVVGYSPVSRFAMLYVTHDGGVTWQYQAISLPEGAFGVSTLPPVFFNATDGILPVVFPGSQSQALNIYITHNGGASWSATTPVPISTLAGAWTGTLTAGAVDFVDTKHGWLVSNTFAVKSHQYLSSQYLNSTVYRTSDGGQRWTRYTVRLKADITMIDFVSPAQGWAIDSTQSLYQTIDGGQTWAKVTPYAA